MPTNLYGPGDNYHPENSHVIPALIRKFHEAKSNNLSKVVIWGTGMPRREFLYVDDMASASVFVMKLDKETFDQQTAPMQSHINVGFGSDITILELAQKIQAVVGYTGKIIFDTSKPDGSPQKLLDSSQINLLGWTPNVDLNKGLALTFSDMLRRCN